MTKPILTIAIPTYARPQHLKNLVEGLLPQLNSRIKLVVVDNQSPVPARELLPPEVEVIRNPVNIGAAGNFPRCFELADTDWFWIIGDDDLVDPDAVERVLAMIAQYPDAAILNFGAHNRSIRKETSVFHGFSEFLAGTDSVSESIWMSANVYATKHYRPHLGMAYRFANTCSSHYVLLIMALLEGGTYIQLPHPVCRQSVDDFDGSGNFGELITGVMALAELPMSRQQQLKFSQLLQQGFVNFRRDIYFSFHHAADVDGVERSEVLFLFLLRWTRWALIRGSLSLFVLAVLVRIILGTSVGRAGLGLVEKLRERVTGKRLNAPQSRSRFYRQV